MAASMRVKARRTVLVLDKLFRYRRCLCSFKHVDAHLHRYRCIYRQLSQKVSNLQSGDKQDESEDFFGISEDFKLQNFRHNDKRMEQSTDSFIQMASLPHTPEDHFGSKISRTGQGYSLSHEDDLQSTGAGGRSRIKRRKLKQRAELSTAFGTVTIDQRSFVATGINTTDSSIDTSNDAGSRDSGCATEPLNDMGKGKTVETSASERQRHSPLSNNLFDEHYFGGQLEEHKVYPSLEMSSTQPDPQNPAQSIIDEQYFDESLQLSGNEMKLGENCQKEKQDEFNEVDKQYFGDTFRTANATHSGCTKHSHSPSMYDVFEQYSQPGSNVHEKISQSVVTHDQSESSTNSDPGQSKGKIIIASEREEQMNEISPLLMSKESFMNCHARGMVEKQTPNLDNPCTAFDVAMKIRLSKAEEDKSSALDSSPLDIAEDTFHKETAHGVRVDSKGYRLLDKQTPQLDKMTSADIVRVLKQRIIFDHDDFLAIDKPYGLPCYSQKQDRFSLTELLPSLADILPKSFHASNLHLVQGLDRDVTGAVILAKNPEVASILRGTYSNSKEVIQRFWAITKGFPTPRAGIIDIPLGEGKVGDVYKMVLRPRYTKEQKSVAKLSKAPSTPAITEYKVLSAHMESALVECRLLTNNVQHQIRVHLASGLNTPILGDHKYSHFSKLAPQKLHKTMLDLLGVRQAKVRHIALHLHCHSVVLTNYNGRMIFLTTRPPTHFRENMNRLKLVMPKK